ncbi:unnamed protein product [Blepharisma stoltei]|uniref:Uncharacterized protein n=1 Tax=Blepharisma stoltei TaxID=1481888 RepID=A0AAU9J7T2_9CILI|nr:unnamed protein product [Blepharisma stoltei]
MKVMNTNWNGKLNNLASGQLTTTPLIIGLIDHLGSVVTTDDSSVGELISPSQDVILSGELKVTAISGIFTFSSFIISAEPSSNFSIEIQTDGIDSSKSIKANDGLSYNSSLLVDATLRDCVLGEITVGVKCIICPEDLYSLNPKSDQCLPCPDEAICYGNYTMVPKPGYWRSSMLTDSFWPCPNPDACIGSDSQNISYTGNCLEGYTGNLCHSCSEDYAKITKNQCEKCQSLPIVIIKTCAIGIGYIIVCWIMVKMSKKSAYKPKSLTSVYIKILVNYIQLAMITTTFSLSWPSYAKQLFSAQNKGSFIGEQIFSFDCLLYYSRDLRGGTTVIFYQKLFFMALLPISIPIISAIIWSLISYCKRNFSLFVDNIITSSIVAAFFVYPSLIKYYFSSFDCKELDYGEDWLVVDLSLRCWNSQHVFYITAISLPAILLWGIGIPAACLLLIMKNKHRLSSIDVRIKYGFAFNGYKSRSYYWEFVIIYRKIVIICCSIFLSAVSVNIQALTTLFVLVVYLYFQCKIKPYNGDDLNRLETVSIASSAITIYCGMYYLSESLDQFTEMLFFIVIISVNAYFVIYWIIKAGNAYIAIIIEKVPFLRKRFHHKNYENIDIGSNNKKTGDFPYEMILKSSPSENLNHQGIDFKEIKMRDLFFANLKGGMPIIYEEIEKDSIEYSYMEKKSIGGINTEENSFEENCFRLNNSKGLDCKEKIIEEVEGEGKFQII